MGRLFDTVAALLGYTRPTTFEGQAAVWLEHAAASACPSGELPFAFVDRELDFRAAIAKVIERRLAGDDPAGFARSFHEGLATGLQTAVLDLCEAYDVDTVVFSGGVFQNELLLHCLGNRLAATRLSVWTNNRVPANDGGISLGQAALAALKPADPTEYC
jgi:hydrogenase maturation protein HypF